MATINKVLYNINQTNDTTTQEKKQARDNIEASQVNYVNALSPTPSITTGDLNIVQYPSGLHLNNGSGNISPLAPEPQSGENGKILTVKSSGIGWSNNQPSRDIFIKYYRDDNYETSTNKVPIKSIELPKVGNMYPTKIVGTIDCYPEDGYNAISIVPMKSNNYGSSDTTVGLGGDYDPYEDKNNINVHNMLALSPTPGSGSSDGDYRNVISFSFNKKEDIIGNMTYLGIKGLSGGSESTYHIHNIQIQCFYEMEE